MSILDPISIAKRGRRANAGLFLVNGFLMGSWAPEIPFMLPRHGITEFQLGLLILLIGLGAVSAMIWAGWLINHFGSRKITVTLGLVACISFALMVLAPTIPLVIPLLVIFGGALGTMDVAMNANAVELERRLNGAIMSSAHGFWSVGGFIGGAVGGLVIARFGNSNHSLFSAAIGLAVILVD